MDGGSGEGAVQGGVHARAGGVGEPSDVGGEGGVADVCQLLLSEGDVEYDYVYESGGL